MSGEGRSPECEDGAVGGGSKQDADHQGETWAQSRSRNTPRENTTPNHTQDGGASPSFIEPGAQGRRSSPELGALIGLDPSCGPPAWAGFRVDVGAARSPYC